MTAFADEVKPAESLALDRKLPKYEAGLGFGAFYLPDYPGSSESHYRWLPLPYFIYRGDILRADREGGVRGRFVHRENFEFDLSFNAAFNADSEDNKAREGMEDLDWIGEMGPRVQYYLVRRGPARLTLQLPVRFVFSARADGGLRTRSRGFVFNPELVLRHRVPQRPLMAVRASAGGTWATEELMDYFYEVEPRHARPNRPVYNAQGGYLGANLSASVLRFFPAWHFTVFVGCSVDFYDGAKNRLSPLLTDRITSSYVLGMMWSLYRSEEREN